MVQSTIPKLYNGRDRTFFFGSWEKTEADRPKHQHRLRAHPGNGKGGDFSALGGYNVTSKTCVPNGTVAICLKDPLNHRRILPQQPSSPRANLGSMRNGLIAQKLEKYFRGAERGWDSQNGTLQQLE